MAKSIVLLITSMLFFFGAAAARENEETALDHFAAYEEALASGGIEEALKEAKLAYNAARREWGRKDRRTGLMASNYGIALLLAGDNRGAKRIFSQCIAIFEAANDQSADKAYCHYNLGVAHENTGRETIAVASYEDALVILEPLVKSDPQALALAAEVSLVAAKTAIRIDFKKPARYRSAQAYGRDRNERFSKLHVLMTRAEKYNRDAFGPDSLQYVGALIQMAMLSQRYNKSDITRDSLARAYLVLQSLYPPEHPEVQSVLARLLHTEAGNTHTTLIGARDLAPASQRVTDKCNPADAPPGDPGSVACGVVRWPPKYPANGPLVSGFVVLVFDVMEDGSTTNIRVAESKPPGRFDQAAIRSVERWRYSILRDADGNPQTRKDIDTAVTFELVGEPVPYREWYCSTFPVADDAFTTCTRSRKLPDYPKNELYAGVIGYALVHYDINETGGVDNVIVPQSWPGTEYGEAARAAVESWVYSPPVNAQGEITAITGVETALTFIVETP